MTDSDECAPFWFMRHGETDWNRDGLIQGSTDIALNEAGWAQARAAAGVLAGRGITSVWCSPLQRARDSAGVVAEALGLPLTVEPGLREASFGKHEGEVMGAWFTAWAEGLRRCPRAARAFADLTTRAVAAMNAGAGGRRAAVRGGAWRIFPCRARGDGLRHHDPDRQRGAGAVRAGPG